MTAASPTYLAALEFNTESSWGEDSDVFGTRALPVGGVTLDLQQAKIIPDILKQRPHEGVVGYLGPQQGSISFALELTGHGGTAAGALTATDMATILGHFIGVLDVTGVGGTADGTGTASAPGFAGGAVFADGLLARIGERGDTRGNGQFVRVSNDNASVLTLLTAVDGAPSNGDVIFAAQCIYPSETPGIYEVVQSMRFQYATPNGQYQLYGCYPQSIAITGWNAGEVTQVTLTYGISWFRAPANALSFPRTAGTNAKDGVMVGGGSLFLQDYGTATRQTFDVRNFEVSLDNVVTPIMGVDGAIGPYQTVVDARRKRCAMTVTATFDKPAAADGQTFEDMFDALGYQHLLYTASSIDGRAVGLYLPRARMIENRPSQVDVDGLNRVTASWEALTNIVTTSDATMAAWMLASG